VNAVAVHVTSDWALATVPATDVGALEVNAKRVVVEVLCPSTLFTTTLVAPEVPAGDVTTNCVALREFTVALTPPMVTWAPTPTVEKPVPAIVIEAPERSPMEAGVMPVMTGAATVPVGVVKDAVDPYVVPTLLVATE
jgi:hypothetical protein